MYHLEAQTAIVAETTNNVFPGKKQTAKKTQIQRHKIERRGENCTMKGQSQIPPTKLKGKKKFEPL